MVVDGDAIEHILKRGGFGGINWSLITKALLSLQNDCRLHRDRSGKKRFFAITEAGHQPRFRCLHDQTNSGMRINRLFPNYFLYPARKTSGKVLVDAIATLKAAGYRYNIGDTASE